MQPIATRMGEVGLEWPSGQSGRRVLEVVTAGLRGPLSPLASPLEYLYAGAMSVRNRAFDQGLLSTHRVSVPVISVGNIVAGGAGKTPMVRLLTHELIARERRPAILHGGYGGDEPMLHRQWHPDIIVIAERDRVAAALRAIEQGADVILLDDAFQHRRLARDLDIVLLSAENTNAHLLPRGPGREPLRSLSRAGIVVVTRKTASTDRALILETTVHQTASRPRTARAHLRLQGKLPDQAMLVVASIARPDVFVEQLRELGARIDTALAYPDHYDFTPDDAAYIADRAGGNLIVMTAKDAVKLRPLMPERPLHVVDQEIVFESGLAELMTAVDNVL